MVLRFRFNCAIIPLAEKKQHLGVAQLVARYLGVVEAVGSSPVTQTRCDQHYLKIPISDDIGIFYISLTNLPYYVIMYINKRHVIPHNKEGVYG